MAVKRKPTIKATFETGDRPTEAEFGDFIDSYVPIETDGAVGFMEVISTASSLARPTETLVAIATGAQGGKTGVIEVLATADVTALPAGAVGREVLSAAATASAQGHLGGGAFGVQVFEAATTAAGLDLLNVATASETNFGIVEIATQAEMEATTATDRAATPDNAQYHPGVAKAWVNFTGTGTAAINESHNVTSITDNGTGDYTVTFDEDFATAEYSYSINAQRNITNADFSAGVPAGQTPAVGSIRFNTLVSSVGITEDAKRVLVQAWGDQ